MRPIAHLLWTSVKTEIERRTSLNRKCIPPFLFCFLFSVISNIYISAYFFLTELDVVRYNSQNNFFGLSLDKTDHVIQHRTMVTRPYPPSDLISSVWYCFDGVKAQIRVSVQAKLLIGHEKQENTFCRSQWRRNLKAGWQFRTKKHEKIRKTYRDYLRAFALRNDSQGYKRNKPFWLARISEGNAQGWKIVRKMNGWPRREASRQRWNFEDNLSSKSIILRYTSRRKGFIYEIYVRCTFLSYCVFACDGGLVDNWWLQAVSVERGCVLSSVVACLSRSGGGGGGIISLYRCS